MTEVLDYLYSSSVWMTVILCVVMFLCVGLAFANPFKRKNLNYAYKVFLYVFAFCFMMSFQFMYYGYADEFKSMHIGKKTICLFEVYERGGEGPDETVYRLHVINKNDGVRKDRFYLGWSAKMLGIRNDSICYLEENDLVLFDADNLKEIYTIKIEEWGSFLPELAVGIESIYSYNDKRNAYAELNCKNGKKYWFDPFTKKVLTKEPKENGSPVFSKEDYELAIDDGHGNKRYILNDAYGADKLKIIVPGEYGKKFFKTVDSTTYLDPFFLAIDTLKQVFVFGHYTTTDREDFYIEAKDFEFSTKWKKASAEIASDSYNKPKVNVWQYVNEILYFNIGGFVIAIEPATGKTIWTSRL